MTSSCVFLFRFWFFFYLSFVQMRAHPPSMGGKSTRRLFTPSEFPVCLPPSGPLLFPPFSLLAFPLGPKARAMPAFSRSLQWRPCRCSTTRTLVVKVVVEFMAGNDKREEGGGGYFPLVLLVGQIALQTFLCIFSLHSFTYVVCSVGICRLNYFERICVPFLLRNQYSFRMFLFSDELDDEKMADFFMLLRKVKQKNRLKITLKKETSKNLFLF